MGATKKPAAGAPGKVGKAKIMFVDIFFLNGFLFKNIF